MIEWRPFTLSKGVRIVNVPGVSSLKVFAADDALALAALYGDWRRLGGTMVAQGVWRAPKPSLTDLGLMWGDKVLRDKGVREDGLRGVIGQYTLDQWQSTAVTRIAAMREQQLWRPTLYEFRDASNRLLHVGNAVTLPRRGVVLRAPNGAGKSVVCLALASQSRSSMIVVGRETIDDWRRKAAIAHVDFVVADRFTKISNWDGKGCILVPSSLLSNQGTKALAVLNREVHLLVLDNCEDLGCLATLRSLAARFCIATTRSSIESLSAARQVHLTEIFGLDPARDIRGALQCLKDCWYRVARPTRLYGPYAGVEIITVSNGDARARRTARATQSLVCTPWQSALGCALGLLEGGLGICPPCPPAAGTQFFRERFCAILSSALVLLLCPICLEELPIGSMCLNLCGHVFCSSCEGSLRNGRFCSVCRAERPARSPQVACKDIVEGRVEVPQPLYAIPVGSRAVVVVHENECFLAVEGFLRHLGHEVVSIHSPRTRCVSLRLWRRGRASLLLLSPRSITGVMLDCSEVFWCTIAGTRSDVHSVMAMVTRRGSSYDSVRVRVIVGSDIKVGRGLGRMVQWIRSCTRSSNVET